MKARRDAPPPGLGWRRRLLLAGWIGAGAAVLIRSAQVQILQADEWRAIAQEQHLASSEIPAPRGQILDRNGVPLALSRERFEIAVAPREVRAGERDDLLAVLRDELGVPRGRLREIEQGTKGWVFLGKDFGTTDRERVRRFHGVHVERDLTREYPYGSLALGVLGRQVDGVWRGGIEQAYDDHLAGISGQEQSAKDHNGRPIPGQTVTLREPRPGGDVVLTLDADLQEIAEKALFEAIRTSEARGGDVVVADPFTGEILALASIKGGNTNALSAINAPYEPGSTLKPFTVAALLEHGLAELDDSVDIGNGSWAINGRVLHDTHGSGVITLGEALQESSNVGVAKMAQGLSPQRQYENLRAFGFGSPTGIPLPGEASGSLPHPDEWSKPTPQSLAVGYEISVTPLQMVMAYSALANGGTLPEPRLIREVRGTDGSVERLRPRALRRVVGREVTQALGEVLVDVVEQGTGTQAQLETYRVAGKSGTARISENGRYQAGLYFASFVGYFPADDPQIVVFAKLDAPRGSIYGGAVAAPVTRATMEAALASRQSPLSRSKLLRSNRSAAASSAPAPALLDSRFVAAEGPVADAPSAGAGDLRVPDVRGLTPRAAIRRLHAAGFRVSSPASGAVTGTEPAAGTRLAPGDTVRLRVRGGSP